MASPFSASFHLSESAKYLARFPLLLSWFRGSYAGSFLTLSTLGFQSSMCSACGTGSVAFCQFVVGASRRSAAPGSQSIGSQLLAASSSEFTHRTLPAKVEGFSRQVLSGFSASHKPR
jgi:hypothetical protein